MIHVRTPMAPARCATDVQDEITRSHLATSRWVSRHVSSDGRDMKAGAASAPSSRCSDTTSHPMAA